MFAAFLMVECEMATVKMSKSSSFGGQFIMLSENIFDVCSYDAVIRCARN